MLAWAIVVEPLYDRAIATTARMLLQRLESPRMTGAVRFADEYAIVGHTEAFQQLGEQRLELRTHHNNMPLLVALLLATPGLPWRRRVRALLLGYAVLGLTHILHFMLAVHWLYAFSNVGPYRVTDLRYLTRSFWTSLDNSAQVAKALVVGAEAFYTHVGRLLAPMLVWIALCWDRVRPQSGGESGLRAANAQEGGSPTDRVKAPAL